MLMLHSVSEYIVTYIYVTLRFRNISTRLEHSFMCQLSGWISCRAEQSVRNQSVFTILVTHIEIVLISLTLTAIRVKLLIAISRVYQLVRS